jgi:uncharacterized membrane protein
LSSSPESSAGGSARRAYIDWARGFAVLIMIQAHVLDAWTAPSERGSAWFAAFNLLGGLAAPMFLWLAGLSLVLAAERRLARTGDRSGAARSLLRRGAEIFVLAFGFRLQAFIVSPGNPLVSLLRVDILNIMGPAMMAAALIWGAARRPAVAAAILGGCAALIAMVTPLVRNASWLHLLPSVVQWYLSPNGNHSTFTLFPWSGFLFAGAVAGMMLARVDRLVEGAALRWVAAAGAALMLGGYLASLLPAIYADSSFWHTSPTYFAIRVGLLMVSLAVLFRLSPVAAYLPTAAGVLATFGRHSLFVYWIHVELVYGYATMLVHHRLTFWTEALAYVAFCSALYWSIALKNAIVGRWSAPPQRHGPARAVNA